MGTDADNEACLKVTRPLLGSPLIVLLGSSDMLWGCMNHGTDELRAPELKTHCSLKQCSPHAMDERFRGTLALSTQTSTFISLRKHRPEALRVTGSSPATIRFSSGVWTLYYYPTPNHLQNLPSGVLQKEKLYKEVNPWRSQQVAGKPGEESS